MAVALQIQKCYLMACNPRGRDSHGAISNASGRELLENSSWYDCRGREIISVHCKSERRTEVVVMLRDRANMGAFLLLATSTMLGRNNN